jgi:hypothetical protein
MDATADGQEGHTMSSLQLLDLLGQAVGIGAAGAAVAFFPAMNGTTPASGAVIAFAIGLAIVLIALAVVQRLPKSISAPAQPGQGAATHIHHPRGDEVSSPA